MQALATRVRGNHSLQLADRYSRPLRYHSLSPQLCMLRQVAAARSPVGSSLPPGRGRSLPCASTRAHLLPRMSNSPTSLGASWPSGRTTFITRLGREIASAPLALYLFISHEVLWPSWSCRNRLEGHAACPNRSNTVEEGLAALISIGTGSPAFCQAGLLLMAMNM